MERRKAFTLMDLLAVMVAGMLLLTGACVVIQENTSSELKNRRSLCAANLNGIGKGLVLYMGDYDDCTPWIDSADWSSTTGTNAKSTSTPAKVSPTALMFLIVRSGQPVDLFNCPSDKNATRMSSTRFTIGNDSYYYWDFYDTKKANPSATDNCKKVSYSYQAPLYDPSGKSYSSGCVLGGGALAVMADKTPGFDGKTPCTNWAGNLTEKQRKAGMSQNHGSGEFINVLFADCHVSGGKRADVGVGDDNIYSASNNADAGTQGAGSTILKHHLSEDDSFLIGPIK